MGIKESKSVSETFEDEGSGIVTLVSPENQENADPVLLQLHELVHGGAILEPSVGVRWREFLKPATAGPSTDVKTLQGMLDDYQKYCKEGSLVIIKKQSQIQGLIETLDKHAAQSVHLTSRTLSEAEQAMVNLGGVDILAGQVEKLGQQMMALQKRLEELSNAVEQVSFSRASRMA